MASHYNWDDGFAALIAVGGFGERHEDWLDFVSSLATRVRAGDCPRGPNGYDPALNRRQLIKFKKAGVPPVFLTPLEVVLE